MAHLDEYTLGALEKKYPQLKVDAVQLGARSQIRPLQDEPSSIFTYEMVSLEKSGKLTSQSQFDSWFWLFAKRALYDATFEKSELSWFVVAALDVMNHSSLRVNSNDYKPFLMTLVLRSMGDRDNLTAATKTISREEMLMTDLAVSWAPKFSEIDKTYWSLRAASFFLDQKLMKDYVSSLDLADEAEAANLNRFLWEFNERFMRGFITEQALSLADPLFLAITDKLTGDISERGLDVWNFRALLQVAAVIGPHKKSILRRTAEIMKKGMTLTPTFARTADAHDELFAQVKMRWVYDGYW